MSDLRYHPPAGHFPPIRVVDGSAATSHSYGPHDRQTGTRMSKLDYGPELDAKCDRLQSQGMFLFARGLNSRGMDYWNLRLVKLGHMMEGETATGVTKRVELSSLNRVLRKIENEIDKVMRKHGLWDEWRVWAGERGGEATRAAEQAGPWLCGNCGHGGAEQEFAPDGDERVCPKCGAYAFFVGEQLTEA